MNNFFSKNKIILLIISVLITGYKVNYLNNMNTCKKSIFPIKEIPNKKIISKIINRIDSISASHEYCENVVIYYEKIIESDIEEFYIINMEENKTTKLEVIDSKITRKSIYSNKSTLNNLPKKYYGNVYSKDHLIEDGVISVFIFKSNKIPMAYFLSFGFTWEENCKNGNDTLINFSKYLNDNMFWQIIR